MPHLTSVMVTDVSLVLLICQSTVQGRSIVSFINVMCIEWYGDDDACSSFFTAVASTISRMLPSVYFDTIRTAMHLVCFLLLFICYGRLSVCVG